MSLKKIYAILLIIITVCINFSAFAGMNTDFNRIENENTDGENRGGNSGGSSSVGAGSSVQPIKAVQPPRTPSAEEQSCREKYPYEAITRDKAYNDCVAQARANAEIIKNAPPNPGEPPVYTCGQKTNPIEKITCDNDYNAQAMAYDAKVKAYQDYWAAHPTVIRETSVTDLIQATVWKQERTIVLLKIIQIAVGILAGVTIAIATSMLVATLGASVQGWIMLAAGIALTLVASVVIPKQIKDLEDAKIKTCEQYNQVATVKIKTCSPTQAPTTIEGGPQVIAKGFFGSSGVSQIPSFIDPKTGQCKAPASAECQLVVSNAPKDCFKSKTKDNVSCLASMNKNNQSVPVVSNGKVSLNVNGKQKTYGIEDFANEASMVKAGFTPAQAKQFQNLMNSPNSILAQNGLNPKGELKNGFSFPYVSPNKPSSSFESSGEGQPGANMNIKKDEYGPALSNQEVARTPALAEGLTKDYHGDTIGAEGDNVFKMINRRYNLKQKQNIFIEQ